MNYLGLNLSTLIVTITAVFVAGIIRGYSGFGSKMFIKVDKESFRHHVLILLMILSIAGLLRGIMI